jgi:hypothetical protein
MHRRYHSVATCSIHELRPRACGVRETGVYNFFDDLTYLSCLDVGGCAEIRHAADLGQEANLLFLIMCGRDRNAREHKRHAFERGDTASTDREIRVCHELRDVADCMVETNIRMRSELIPDAGPLVVRTTHDDGEYESVSLQSQEGQKLVDYAFRFARGISASEEDKDVPNGPGARPAALA